MSYDGGCGDADCTLCQHDGYIARLEHENARLRAALEALVDIDDGDDPGLWNYEALFENARQALLAEAEQPAESHEK